MKKTSASPEKEGDGTARIIIADSNDFGDSSLLETLCDELIPRYEPVEIVVSNASLGLHYAKNRMYPVTVFQSDFKLYGRMAYIFRNEQMVKYAMKDSHPMLIVFQKQKSYEIENLIKAAKYYGISTHVFGGD